MRVAIAGKFDTIHEGHIDHIVKASAIGDYLYIITHSDDVLAKIKGKCYVPLWARILLLRGLLKQLSINGEVVISDDDDGLSVKTLDRLCPDVFCKGGDRTPDNMPKQEVELCKSRGIKIIYNVGKQLNSSSNINEGK